MEVPGQSNLKRNSHSRSSHSKKVSANSEESTNQGLTVRISQLSRERSRNLQYRNGVNMKSYQQMIGCAKENFSDIVQGLVGREECTICCKTNDLFGFGLCRHPVCMECAIRIRILSKNNQCPVCRTNVETLWFAFASSGLGSISLWFESLNHPDEERFGIRFQNKDVCIRYEKYLAHVCKLCKSANGERLEFQTFVALRHHMSNVHQLTYCHICTDNLMLFSRERKTYTRDALQRHIRCGDKEDKSLKGHPSCLFCEQRFFDEECRYRHLRKEHFFCQFCENEGRHFNIFFGGRDDLMCHYKAKHFVCEVEECRELGIVFANQIDLNLHKSREHSGRRGAVALDFQYNGRQLAGSSRPKRDVPDAQNAPVIRRDKISVIQQEQVSQPRRKPNEYIVVPSAQSNNRAIRSNVSPLYTLHSEDFPSLGNSPNSVTSLRPDDFPQLNRVNRANPHGNSSASTQSTVRDSSSRGFPSSSNISKNGCESAVEDFPALSVSRGRSSVTSAWSSKKSFKSIISPDEVPSNTRTLPQPDIWPLNISTPSTTDVETEQWHEVPGKPRKFDKKQRPAQRKAVVWESNDVSSTEQRPFGKESNKPSVISSSNFEKNNELSELSASDGTVENMLRDFTNEERRRNKWLKREQKPIANPDNVERNVLENGMDSHDPLSNEKFAEDSQSALSSETFVHSSSTINLSKPYTGSMFSNLSLSNLFDVEPFKKDEVPSLHCSVTASDRGPQSQEVAVVAQNVDTPPGVYIGPSSTSDILLGPPPGFENVCIVGSAPPGLSIISASPSQFPKTTLIPQSDTKNTSIETIQKPEDECYDSNEN